MGQRLNFSGKERCTLERLLAFETSTEAFSVALKLGEAVLERFEVAPRRHAEKLLLTVDQLLKESHLELAELDGIAFGRGPGSFIGVRIATGAAQGLALGASLPVVPVSSLLALAWPLLKESEGVLSLMDARMGEVYAARFRWEGERVVGEERLAPLEEVLGSLPGERLPVVTCGLAPSLFPEGAQVVEGYPRASSVAEIAARQGEVCPPEEAQPVYLRQKVAQVPSEAAEEVPKSREKDQSAS